MLHNGFFINANTISVSQNFKKMMTDKFNRKNAALKSAIIFGGILPLHESRTPIATCEACDENENRTCWCSPLPHLGHRDSKWPRTSPANASQSTMRSTWTTRAHRHGRKRVLRSKANVLCKFHRVSPSATSRNHSRSERLRLRSWLSTDVRSCRAQNHVAASSRPQATSSNCSG